MERPDSNPSGEEPLRLTKNSDPIPRPEMPRVPSPPLVAPRPPAPRPGTPGGSQVSNTFSMDDYRQAPADPSVQAEAPATAEPQQPKPETDPPKASSQDPAPASDGPRDVRSRPLLFGPEPAPPKPPSPWIGAATLLQARPLWVLVVLVGVLTTILMIPRSKEDSVRAIRSESAAYDGRTVKVRGRAGESFDIADGHVYYLFQGRDTIVVFTHGTPPLRKKEVVVTGTVSTGYMDGQPRLALFETPGD